MASKRLRPTLPVETDVATRELRSRGGRRRPPLHAPVESAHVVRPHSGVAGLRRLFDDSLILADGASPGASLAGAGALDLFGTPFATGAQWVLANRVLVSASYLLFAACAAVFLLSRRLRIVRKGSNSKTAAGAARSQGIQNKISREDAQ